MRQSEARLILVLNVELVYLDNVGQHIVGVHMWCEVAGYWELPTRGLWRISVLKIGYVQLPYISSSRARPSCLYHRMRKATPRRASQQHEW